MDEIGSFFLLHDIKLNISSLNMLGTFPKLISCDPSINKYANNTPSTMSRIESTSTLIEL